MLGWVQLVRSQDSGSGNFENDAFEHWNTHTETLRTTFPFWLFADYPDSN